MQITARSDRDLSPESIIQKVSDASGSKYSAGSSVAGSGGPPPPVSSKPAFNPTQSSRGNSGFNPLVSSRPRATATQDPSLDEDGWGADAPPVTRSELEKVQSAYQPTKVNMRELSSRNPETSSSNGNSEQNELRNDITKGTYQPVGKVDIAALRRQAQPSGNAADDKPTVVKGAYEPVGKVDIAAIRAQAQRPLERTASPPYSSSPAGADMSAQNDGEQKSRPGYPRPSDTSERLTTLPKPKVANRFGAGSNNFTGTKAPTPGGFGLESKAPPTPTPVGVGRTFADQGGKTPAQIWAERKARERGISGASDNPPSLSSGAPVSPIASQTSGGGEWKSGYTGKSWAAVQTTRTGQSASSIGEQRTGEAEQAPEEGQPSPSGGIGALRDRFQTAPLMGAPDASSTRAVPGPPQLDTSNKPNAGKGIPIPGLQTQPSLAQEDEVEGYRVPTPPAQPPRSPTPPTPPAIETGSPIRIAMPVGRGQDQEIENARDEQFSPPAMPTRSLAQQVPREDTLTDEPSGHDPARAISEAAVVASFGNHASENVGQDADRGGKQALVQYDYEKAEDNELELKEGEFVTNIEMVDADWWMGENSRGETGLFPSNYVEVVQNGSARSPVHQPEPEPKQDPNPEAEAVHSPVASAGHANVAAGHTATALYDYEAAEDNELTFPENAKITGIVSTHPASHSQNG